MSTFRHKLIENSIYGLLYFCFALIILFLVIISFYIFKNSAGTLSLSFIFEYPRNGMTEGGIFPIIIGTCFVTIISAIFAIPIGISGAIYLNEYAKKSFFTNIIRLSIRNLAAVPSIVYGLFGLAIFVKTLNLGTCVLSAGLTLGLLTLPTIITASEEALKNVPAAYREGALALGLTKWQVLRTNVIPVAVPGIITGIILSISRALGETAPILFTGAAFYIPHLSLNVLDQFMALPYHLYIMSTQHHDISGVRGIAYSTAAILILITLILNIIASTIRYRYRNAFK
ncbi:MAG: phosphate ABC transporter, permease protein PstA [Candidatus Margulisbacteria bacterium GWF2_35_9]|nr:MAG: phosphate ABC transporter, permease protein PstA [Candidatus Margulisbacteria bacterium GWF2_35_9]